MGRHGDPIPQERKRFQLMTQPGKKPAKIPKVSELVVGMPKVPPPKEVMDKLKGCELIIGIDVETHDLIQGNTLLWIPGQFGFQSKTDLSIISALRVVQIGWAIGKTTASTLDLQLRRGQRESTIFHRIKPLIKGNHYEILFKL